MTEHECCWHMTETFATTPATVRERCCWCGTGRTVRYTPPSATDMTRLRGKAEGVRLALSYLRSYSETEASA